MYWSQHYQLAYLSSYRPWTTPTTNNTRPFIHTQISLVHWAKFKLYFNFNVVYLYLILLLRDVKNVKNSYKYNSDQIKMDTHALICDFVLAYRGSHAQVVAFTGPGSQACYQILGSTSDSSFGLFLIEGIFTCMHLGQTKTSCLLGLTHSVFPILTFSVPAAGLLHFLTSVLTLLTTCLPF